MGVLRARGIESEAQLPYAGLHQLLRPLLGDIDDAAGAAGARAARRARPRGGSERRVVPRLARRAEPARGGRRAPAAAVPRRRRALARRRLGRVAGVRRQTARGRARGRCCSRHATATSARFEAPEFDELSPRRPRRRRRGRAARRSAPSVALSPEARDRLIDGTGGNPLALLELSATLSDEQLTAPSRCSSRCRSARGSSGRSSQRVRTLPAADADAAARRRRRRARRTRRRCCARRPQLGAGPEALDAAEQAGLLRVDGARLEFRHPLVRSAVYHGAPLSRRQAAHRALADALDARSSRPAGLAPRRRLRPARRRGRRRSSSRRRGGRAGAAASSPPRWRFERAAALATERAAARAAADRGGRERVVRAGGRSGRRCCSSARCPSVAEPAERAGHRLLARR